MEDAQKSKPIDFTRAFPERLLNDLLSMRRRAANAPPKFLKDAAAHEALTLASMLFNQLAGWARDHVVGRILASIPSAPYAEGTRAERELGDTRPWDDPALEKRGAQYMFDDPSTNQRIVAELAAKLSYVFGYRLASQLGESFRALQFNQVNDLVSPRATYRKGSSYRLWLLRFYAVRHVEFLRGTGLRKYDAQDIVAEAYGLDDEISLAGRGTLGKWEQRLPELLDPFMVRDGLFTARNGGEHYTALKKRSDLGGFEAERFQILEEEFGSDALRQRGRSYQSFQRR